MTTSDQRTGSGWRDRAKPGHLVLGALGLVALFTALGTWQLERRAWKHALIERVAQRVRAAPADAPGPGQWPLVNPERDEYRHVNVSGTFIGGRATLVQAATVLGSGYWVLVPLRMTGGAVVLINRGFVTSARGEARSRGDDAPAGQVTITGLLRITEPGGSFLRSNDPAADHWFSRDVQAIAQARGLTGVAPYFIDADGAPAATGTGVDGPVAGLTVISFPDNHLPYAITWYALAALVVVAARVAVRAGRRG